MRVPFRPWGSRSVATRPPGPGTQDRPRTRRSWPSQSGASSPRSIGCGSSRRRSAVRSPARWVPSRSMRDTRHRSLSYTIDNATAPKNENACTCPSTHSLGRRRSVRANVRRIALRQVKGEEMHLLLDPGDDRPRFAEISLRVPWRMRQRHEHLPAMAAMLTNVVLQDRVPTGESVLVTKTLEDALRGVPLLPIPRARAASTHCASGPWPWAGRPSASS